MSRFPLCVLCVVVFALASPAHAALLLRANFDNETVNQTIPTGGAAAGEPISMDIPGMAIVDQGPFATPSLQIIDASTNGATAVTYEFLNSANVTAGTVRISFRLKFAILGNYSVGVRSQGSDADDLFDLGFFQSGHYDFGGVSTYDTVNPMAIDILFDMDLRTYSLVVNGNTVAQSVPVGSVTGGVGRLLLEQSFDSDTSGAYDIDDLVVVTPADTIFVDGFDVP